MGCEDYRRKRYKRVKRGQEICRETHRATTNCIYERKSQKQRMYQGLTKINIGIHGQRQNKAAVKCFAVCLLMKHRLKRMHAQERLGQRRSNITLSEFTFERMSCFMKIFISKRADERQIIAPQIPNQRTIGSIDQPFNYLIRDKQRQKTKQNQFENNGTSARPTILAHTCCTKETAIFFL